MVNILKTVYLSSHLVYIFRDFLQKAKQINIFYVISSFVAYIQWFKDLHIFNGLRVQMGLPTYGLHCTCNWGNRIFNVVLVHGQH